MRLFEETKILGIAVKNDYGKVGEETNIIDKNGNKLKVGDIVKFSYSEKKQTFYSTTVVAYNEDDNKFFLMGIESEINFDGSYSERIIIEKIFDGDKIADKSAFILGENVFWYEEE